MKRAWTLVATAICIVLLGCENDETPTAIRVIVDSDLELGRELTKLEVRVFDPAGEEEWRRQDFALSQTRASTQFTLPLSFRLAPQSQGSTRDFLLVVTGVGPLGEGGSEIEVVEQQALASFRPGETLRLDMFLAKTCLLELCRRDGERSELSCDVQTGSCQQVLHREDLPVARGDGIDDYEEAKADARDVGPLDGGQPAADGGTAEDGATDDGRVVPDGAARGSAIAQVDQECDYEGEKACGGNNSRQALECIRGRWTSRTACEANQRCDTRDESTRGTCQDVAGPCLGQQPGAIACQGRELVTCGADLLDYVSRPCGDNQHCTTGEPASCACDERFEGDGEEGCRAVDDCAGNPCQHGGKCIDGPGSYQCDCSGTGYDGDRCERDIDECAGLNRCSLQDYPCVQTRPPGYTCQGQMADWPMPDVTRGAKFAPSFASIGTDVIRDNQTGLSWLRTAADNSLNWAEAVAECSASMAGGKTDWRLPSVIELASLLDVETFRVSAAYDTNTFATTLGGAFFWTSSPNVQTPGDRWYLNMSNGAILHQAERLTGRAWCVRNEPLASGTPDGRYFVDRASASVTDTRTHLTWSTNSSTQSWDNASLYCSALGPSWRVPTYKELLTIVDRTSLDPAVAPEFSNGASHPFWSSNYDDGIVGEMGEPLGSYGLAVVFFDGLGGIAPVSAMLSVRCVR